MFVVASRGKARQSGSDKKARGGAGDFWGKARLLFLFSFILIFFLLLSSISVVPSPIMTQTNGVQKAVPSALPLVQKLSQDHDLVLKTFRLLIADLCQQFSGGHPGYVLLGLR